MKTDDLISALATDLPTRGPGHLRKQLLAAMTAAALAALIGVALWLGFRPDLAEAATGLIFWSKAAYTMAIAVTAVWLVDRSGRPGGDIRAPLILLGAVLLTVTGLALVELLTTPAGERMVTLMGRSAGVCPLNITLLVVLATRRFAPERPGLTGAAAGLVAAGIAASLYGLHCPERTAAFVAVWYSLGMAIPALAGAVVGRLIWRW
jgi:hypothetical protein